MKTNLIDFEKKVFDIKDEPMPKGAWWWWFWLFFFNNPKNPEKPRQLMILWSTKNEKEIDCNNLKIKLNHPIDRSKLDGAVAAWYFDGEKMHHNFLLEQCNIRISPKGLSTSSTVPTSFSLNKTKNIIKIGKGIEFIAQTSNKHDFIKPTFNFNTFVGNKGYSTLRLNHLVLKGKVRGRPVKGSAYFQRIFVNAPLPSWYWGIFHFENGEVLTYFNPHLLRRSVKKDIKFFDGKRVHAFKDIFIKKSAEKMPNFRVFGENNKEKIEFNVKTYSHSSWTFNKKFFGLLPTKLVYNEYPAFISEFKLLNKKSGEIIDIEKLGKSIGNAEHTTGFLL